MNHSIYSMDSATHLKIVVVALLAATAVAALSLCSHRYSEGSADRIVAVVNAKQPLVVGSFGAHFVR